MAAHSEINDLLENIKKELPARAQDAYEQAVRQATRQQHKIKRRGGFGWWLLEQTVMPKMWRQQRRRQQEEEGLLALFALVVGLLGGAALMYLFDPERGAQRRASLREQANRVAADVSESVQETSNRVRDEVSRVVSEAEDAVEEALDQVGDQVGKAVDAVEDASDQVRDQVSKAADAVEQSAKPVAAQVKSAAGAAKNRAADTALLALVRAEVARGVRSPGAIEMALDNGVVSLTGKILASEVLPLVEKIQALPGVISVDNRLEIHDAPESTSSAPSGAQPQNNGV